MTKMWATESLYIVHMSSGRSWPLQVEKRRGGFKASSPVPALGVNVKFSVSDIKRRPTSYPDYPFKMQSF